MTMSDLKVLRYAVLRTHACTKAWLCWECAFTIDFVIRFIEVKNLKSKYSLKHQYNCSLTKLFFK